MDDYSISDFYELFLDDFNCNYPNSHYAALIEFFKFLCILYKFTCTLFISLIFIKYFIKIFI